MLGFAENLQKCNSRFGKKSYIAARCNETTLCDIMAISALPGMRLFGAVWAILSSLQEI